MRRPAVTAGPDTTEGAAGGPRRVSPRAAGMS